MKENLLLLHGALGAKVQLEGLKNSLNNHFNVYSMNFDGHGGDLSDETYSIDLFVSNLIAFIDENELNEVSVFGYSMGGYVALTAAARYPNRFKQILTLGSKFKWSPEIAAGEIKLLNPEKIAEKVPHFAQRLNELHQPEDWKKVMRKTADMMVEMGEGKRTADEEFAKVQIPVQVGIGDKDNMVSIEETKHVADLLSNGILKIIEGVPHPIEMIKPEVLEAYVTDYFISKN